MLNRDWIDFKRDVTWFIREQDSIQLSEVIQGDQVYNLSKLFTSVYPCLSELLKKARVSDVKVNDDKYRLLGWTDQQGETFGWLTRFPPQQIDASLCTEHQLLLTQFGGVTERWNESEDSWLLNLNSALTLEESSEGFQGWEEYINEACSLREYKSYLQPKDYIAFAFEANGNLTLYNKHDASLIMLAHDHGYNHLSPLEGYPEYTFYKIIGCESLVDWVETVAYQAMHRIGR